MIKSSLCDTCQYQVNNRCISECPETVMGYNLNAGDVQDCMSYLTAKPVGSEVIENAISDLITAMADAFTNERKETEPYKEMFKAGRDHTSLLRKLETEMQNPVFDMSDVLEHKFGTEINRKQYQFLLAFPFLCSVLQDKIVEEEGTVCCVDKTFYILAEEFRKLGDET